MYQAGEKNIDVPRPHQDSQILWDHVLIGKINTHEFARRNKNDEHNNTEDEMKPLHGFEK